MKQLAVIGCGRVVERYYVPALRGSHVWHLAAAVDPDPARREWIGRLFPEITVRETLAELPAELAIDAVLIASPPESHGQNAGEAFRRGAHVFVEKPMTATAAEATELVELARRCGRQLLVGFNRRFRPSYGRLRDRLRQLSKDRIVSIRYTLCSDAGQWRPVSPYLGSERLGGGVLDDIASHQLDLLPWLLDRPVLAVSARRAADDPPTSVRIGLRFPGGIEAQCLAGHRGPTIERLEVELDGGTLLATRGGTLYSGYLPLALARSLSSVRDTAIGGLQRLTRRPNVTVGSFRRQLAGWADALDSGCSAAADGAAGARCVGLVETCRASLARDGAWIAT